jgi:Arylsulfotransferase (ASST)
MSSPKRFDLSRGLFYFVLACAGLGLMFGLGLHAGAQQNAVYQLLVGAETTIAEAFSTTATELPTLTHTTPTHFLQPSRHPGAGVTRNELRNNQNDFILLSGFFDHTNELRLIRRNGDIVARWPVSFHNLFPRPEEFIPADSIPATDWNVDTHGALALPDGSVVFNFEWSGLAKLDRCGRVAWTVRRRTHHSIERAEDGGLWVGERRTSTSSDSFPPFRPPYQEDLLLKVSDEGRIVAEHSVPKIFYDNGLAPVLTATTRFQDGMDWDHEIVHLNKIGVLTDAVAADFPMFKAGDLLLSFRDLNVLMVVDRDAQTVKWWQMGPWVRQHDPEFVKGGAIVLFNNNAYLSSLAGSHDDPITPLTMPRVSNLMQIDPRTNQSRVLYGGRPEEELLSVIRGKIDPTPNGGFLVTEFDGGRVFEINAAKRIVWEYINRYNDQAVAEITEARLYPASYFSVHDWSCAAHR